MSRLLLQAIAKHVFRLTIFLATLALVASCFQNPSGSVRKVALGDGSPANPWIVTVKFNPSDHCDITGTTPDPTTCSSGSGFCVERNHKIEWRSDPPNTQYEIFFDPFRGRPYRAKTDGTLSMNIDPNAPIAEYKYSVLGLGCTPTEKNTHDPRIRIDK